jgi:AcrR family transcriptional regulator
MFAKVKKAYPHCIDHSVRTMPAPSLTRDEVVTRVLKVFRDYGYEGASLSLISKATGLGRSSLYHYFPNGKDDMAEAALERATLLMREQAIAPLAGSEPPRERLRRFTQGLDQFYASGSSSCLINVFGIGDAANKFQPELAERLRRLIRALAGVAEEAGVAPAEAALRAEDVLIALHGALVVSRGLGSTAPFQRILQELPDRLLGAAE